ncbi:M10 family metallopeptidase C-terminal domain-containing protein [Siccirubricoccus sp. KC 17139]|uniref:M10 family metallopeptidase C-terminal domain-containing protein n=1 Tax=Siccirubricoccus soli TaxID=2899147 RepID=A0ABT1DCR3_9PROT|nr:M10 family metallopeptidase C-terminal domain-containing protein [Siccirubricoccus soli]MCP2685862.1 M10 family metallopeptidase C-terminal domain-containing protein [Siccirubricoccus soli]
MAGSNFADSITGDAGGNQLQGLGGNDTLIGAGGADTLVGGAGADFYVYLALSDSLGAAPDAVVFSKAEGDRIDLSAIDARASEAGDQGFVFLGPMAAFTGGAGGGEITFGPAGANTVILLDTDDANTDPDMVILLAGAVSLAATDFIL